ncbi:type I secretion target repeat protein [Methanosarcina sp. MTP4]|uniref:DUF6923 family protein n=1 Tax=Methanosarcina sp. MTP4 TaxID=1434100 RepID=UPI000615CCE1|nr:hypothetical protein [Methanosarcina sp. MTP4]AKB26166.1 type I secretion target repeat protein [Methanosarcina sp. MTP4]
MITSRKIIFFLAMVALLAMMPGAASAQEPFTCDGKAFVVQDQLANLYNVTLTDGSATLTQILPTATIEYNNLGYRSTDGLLYAAQLQGTGYGDGIVQIIRIDANGNIEGLGLPPGLPTGVQTRFDAGDISADGNTMYITFGARSDDPQTTLGYNLNLYKLDLGSWAGPPNPLPPVTIVSITGDNAWVNDWAYNPNDGLLYGGDQWGTSLNSNSQLSVLNPATGVRTDYDVGFGPTTAFGAAWYDSVRGTIFLYQNTGTIYEIDVSDLGGAGPSILNSWSAPVSTRNDGTFCAGLPAAPEIDIEKSTNGEDADAPPGPTITAGETVTWEYVVNNTGNVPLINVTVTDDQGVTPVYQSGDDGDNILQPGEIWIYNATGTAISGPYANNGTVTQLSKKRDFPLDFPQKSIARERVQKMRL